MQAGLRKALLAFECGLKRDTGNSRTADVRIACVKRESSKPKPCSRSLSLFYRTGIVDGWQAETVDKDNSISSGPETYFGLVDSSLSVHEFDCVRVFLWVKSKRLAWVEFFRKAQASLRVYLGVSEEVDFDLLCEVNE